MRKLGLELIAITITLIPIAFALFNWSKLPESIPIHFNLAGTPDDWVSKSSLIIISLVPLLSHLILIVILRFNKMNLGINPSWIQIIFASIMTITMLTLLIVSLQKEAGINYDFLLIGVITIAIGLFMKFIEPNSLIGIRTPWTLNNREVWRDTHEFSSKALVWVGLLIIVCSLLIKSFTYSVIIIAILGTLIISAVYSYFSYQKFEKH
ncbi:MAG: SdpI family protein [Cyclobacteriaceae bacterium]|nr:SdpI family protein [Cyclobacteriaceae bacterium]